MDDPAPTPCIYVLAGVNGAGKSAIFGAAIKEFDSVYINPDTRASEIMAANPALTRPEANSLAWGETRDLLERAVQQRAAFAFETTLGGNTITRLLMKALDAGVAVRLWYVGLESVDLHIQRVQKRARQGGHDIPESKIRERYAQSRANLLKLLPRLTELNVYDNSFEADLGNNVAPRPRLLLHVVRGQIEQAVELSAAADWVRPILEGAARVAEAGSTDRKPLG